MTYIYNGDITNPIEDTAQFIDSDGTQYPGAFPKNEIVGMVKVVEIVAPSTETHIVHDRSVELINGVPTRKWISTPRTAQDLKDRANLPILTEIKRLEGTTTRQLLDVFSNLGDTPDINNITPRQRLEETIVKITTQRINLQR